MKLRVFLVLTMTFLFLLTADLASAQGLTKQQKIIRLLELSRSSEMSDQMVEHFRSIMSPQVPSGMNPEAREQSELIFDKVMDLAKEKLGPDKLRSQYVAIYDEIYTEEEVGGLLAFYESPAGRAMVDKAPRILEKTMTMLQGQMMQLIPELQRIMADSVRDPGTIR